MKKIFTTLLGIITTIAALSQTNYYVNDNNTSGNVFTSVLGNNANPGTAALPFATIQHAVNVASAGDIIYVDAGTYAEQVTIDKGITIIGAGQNLTSIINPGSPLVPPPGPFAESALIQTIQNIGDVNISNLQTTNVPANEGHSILLQTGGSVKNCRIIDGALGVFFRVESAVKTVVVENNFIQASVFTVACQGSGLTASVLNNTLNVTNPYFSVGIWVGIDFGPIVKLTATGNSINNYVYRGIVGNSYSTVLSENSILGTGQYAIENTASLAVATCNWYGTSDQYAVAAKISGAVNFSPWLVNGTDNNAAIGFQPVPGSCAGRQLFFVNDNSLTGDVYTTAVGNNANNGTYSAPLATITAALTKAQSGDFILVDAGSFTEIVNINKNITILGAGKGVTIINGPAGNITPFPNTGETGIIQTLNGLNEVNIESLTVDGTASNEQHGIFIQGGGRVANCELRYVNDGFYFQYISTQQRLAQGYNNYVHHINYVGSLFAGNGITAIANNNVIDLTGAQSGIGFIAGYGGDGNVASFTASNNSIINVNGFGIMIGSLQAAQVHNNSITRIGGNYSLIQNMHSVNIDATCNWYGTTDAGAIIPYITGAVTYSPWLTNGTDNDLAFGFQPVPNSCNGTAPVITLNASTNVTCFGANNGTINVSVSGGASPFNYSWTKNGDPEFASSSEDLTSLASGTYYLTLTDANGSTAQLQVTITEPPLLTANAGGTNVSCFNGSNGSANVTAGGGTLPYTYLWSNGSTNASITNLSVGTYSVTVTDGNGCTKSASYQVTQPTLLTAVATGTSTACANSATVVASGGTAPYTYLWSNGATTPSITSLPAGTYTVTVTDGHGCQTTASCSVTATEAFNPSASVINVSCFGGSNGSITITNVNGVSPFQFSTNGVNFSTPPSALPYTISGLAIGTYTITVRDANGCTGFITKTITQPTQLIATQNIVQSSCPGSNTGSISAVISGGSPSYSYKWTGPNSYSSTQLNISGLAAGNYSLTVTDSKGCKAILPVTVSAYPSINVSANIINVLCKGAATGSIDLTVTNGTGSGFSYSWSNGSLSQDIFNLAAATYKDTITDIGSGCKVTGSYVINQPGSLIISTNKTNATGCNSLGTITAAGSGGVGPYIYSLNNGTYQSSGFFTGLLAGNYTVTVKDANGCTKTSAIIGIADSGQDEFESNNSKNQAKAITLSATNSARIAIASDAADWFKFTTTSAGSYTLMLTHPNAGFTFNMYSGVNNSPALLPASSNPTTKVYTLAANTTYYISVTGGLSYVCYQFSVSPASFLTRSSGSNVQQETTKNRQPKDEFAVNAYPNPSNTNFNVRIESGSDGPVNIRIMDASGRLIEERKNVSASQIVRFGERYINGVYLVEIIQANNRKTVRVVKM